MTEVVVPLFTHFLPILFFVYMGMDVLLRNTQKTEHRLLSMIILCFLLLFAEEYVRHQLPLEYSAILASVWLSSVGILIPGLGFHLLIKFARIERKLPRFIYPYIFYLPLIIVVLNIFANGQLTSVGEFSQEGIWKQPIYNQAYYITMISCIVNNLLYMIPLLTGKKHAQVKEHKEVLNLIIYGVLLSLIWFMVFGLIPFGESLPPYPYLYGGVIWCFFLRRAMNRYDFLNFIDKRYQKLFNMNPAAILLVDLHGNIKEINPSAMELFGNQQLAHTLYTDILNHEICRRIQNREELDGFETIVYINGQARTVIIDGDYMLLEYEPHVIVMIRDITMQKEQQREIEFLAYHDPLTRLPNRRFFYESLDKAIEDARINRHVLAVILIDLDDFKEVNDQYGHNTGDELLVHVGVMLSEIVGDNGMAARLGGDEFIVFIRQVQSPQVINEMMKQLQLKLAEVAMGLQLTVTVGMSLGASYFPKDGVNAVTLVSNADQAMYTSKGIGKTNDQTEKMA